VVEARGRVALLGVFCLVSATVFTGATVAPIFGLTPTTGAEKKVENASSGLEESSDDLISGGALSPARAFAVLGDAVNVVLNLPQILVNLGLPIAVVSYLTGPVSLVVGLLFIQIAIRQRL
jgi:hypothetical protein